jgi:HlyD family secretion protein
VKRRLLIAAVLIAAVAAAAVWRLGSRDAERDELTLFGNIDLRQVSLAFNGSERIAAVLAHEGDYVHEGDTVAKLDTSRLEPQVAQARAAAAAQRAVVERLRNGSRPEEIAQARANVASAEADAVNARLQHRRLVALVGRKLASQQDVDSAKAAMDAATARAEAAQKALDLLVAGPRQEDIAQAEAQLQAREAELALAETHLADAALVAPLDAVVRSRLLEPGDMASPQKPVLSLAIIDPKWVRAYVPETDLGRVKAGLHASVEVDSFPSRRFEGRIGFVSPVAEFTPKTVQTEELRTSLVYEIRVFVDDPRDELRLGMPATVHVPFDQSASGPESQSARSPSPSGA